MVEKHCLFLGTVVSLIIISESRVIIPRALPKDASSGKGEIPLSINPLEKDNKLDVKPVIWDPPAVDDDFNDYKENIDPVHRPFDGDYNYLPGGGVNKEDNQPGTNPERHPDAEHRNGEPQEIPGEKGGNDNADDEKFDKPLDEVDFDDDADLEWDIDDDDKPIQKDGDESEIRDNDTEENSIDNKPQDEEKLDEEKLDEEKLDEEKKDDDKDGSEDNDEKKYVPEDEPIDDENTEKEIPKEVDEEAVDDNDDDNFDENIPQEGEPRSFFDMPFFNFDAVKKYFSQLDKLLGHIFRQTVDEAILLNGTYANTTEEEVDINGKKYIVTKSVLKGSDNNSMMYVEALSAKSKMNDSEVALNIDTKNVTET